MRRNLTISFDAAWIELLDQRRGKHSRGEFLEALTLESGGWGFGTSYSNPEKGAPGVPEVERSPELPPESSVVNVVQNADGTARRATRSEVLRKPPLQRPIVQKRGK